MSYEEEDRGSVIESRQGREEHMKVCSLVKGEVIFISEHVSEKTKTKKHTSKL